MATDLLSPFATSFAQQHHSGTISVSYSPAQTQAEASRSGSPLRVVGFDSSPTSVVALRRWQSAAVSGTAAAVGAGPEGSPPKSLPPPPHPEQRREEAGERVLWEGEGEVSSEARRPAA